MFGFGFDEPEALRDKIGRLQEASAEQERKLNAQIERLADLLGDLFLLAEPSASPFDWEGTQAEHYARGFEATLIEQAKHARAVCASTCDRIKKELATLGLDPRQVGAMARSRRKAEEKRERAAALRAEAARLEAEAE